PEIPAVFVDMFGSPYTIADINPDLTGSPGRIHSSEVYAVSGSRKRKRSEIALAIDRQGVNIYNVRSCKLAASYAISPEATVTCPPCSLLYRSRGDQPARRYTYCSTKTHQRRILGFLEIGETESGPVTISSFSIAVECTSPVVYVDAILPRVEVGAFSPNHYLLVLHENGHISCYKQELEGMSMSQQLEPMSPKPGEPTRIHVKYAAIASVQEARKALLKDREDITAPLDAESDNAGSSLLLLLSSIGSTRNLDDNCLLFSLYQIRSAEHTYSSLTPGGGLRRLLSCVLPTPRDFPASVSNFILHPSDGLLYQQKQDGMIIYDLGGLVPRVTQSFTSRLDSIVSCLRLSSDLLAASTPSSILVFGLPYCSLQGKMTMSEGQESQSTLNELNLRVYQSPNANVQLLSSFAQMNIVVALHGRKLIAAPISISPLSQKSRKRKQGGLLVDALARGSLVRRLSPGQDGTRGSTKILGSYLTKSHHEGPWSSEESRLTQLLEKGELTAFDDLMTTEHNVLSRQGPHIDQHIVSYVLSKVFTVSCFKQPRNGDIHDSINMLEVSVWPPKTCDWLIRQGLLTVDRIVSSLKYHQIMAPDIRLAPGALTHALAQWDPTLTIVHTLLESPAPLRPVELAHAFLAVMHLIRDDELVEDTRLWMNDEPHISPQGEENTELVNDGEQRRISVSSKPANPSKEILYLILHKLRACPSKDLTQVLRQNFSKAQLRSLIDILRMEIARNGWLSLYLNDLDPSESANANNRLISPIFHVLNSALDTLGPTGWILGSSITDDLTETANTISYMKAEVSAALECIEEATYLKGVLGEILLCGKGVLGPPSNKSLTYTNNQRAVSQPIKPVSVALRDEERRILPLGLRSKPPISTIKIGAGGEVIARSGRDIGRLKSKTVGKYTFERIVV
ncbi:MAG: hypothetical protein Q9217_005976, partial [Psora testacea]